MLTATIRICSLKEIDMFFLLLYCKVFNKWALFLDPLGL